MLIADAQVHIWGPNTPERPWRAGAVKPHREAPLGADELLKEMAVAGVYRAVLVPPSWDADRNDLVLQAAQSHPDRFAVMGRLDVKAPGAQSRFSELRHQPGMFGLRCSFNRPQWTPILTEGHVEWLWKDAEAAGVPIMVMINHSLVPIIDDVAQRYPALKLTLCHLALTSGRYDEDAFRDLDKLLDIAKRPNVNVKVSSLPCYTKDTYPYRRLHPYIRRVYDAFGPKRMFWGTDLARLPCTYHQAVTMFTEEIPWLTAEDKEWIMGRALCEWLGWDFPASKTDDGAERA